MRHWFTADLHMGHSNIIRYCHRPFKDVKEMNEIIIRKWNERVSPEDTVIHNGDFGFKSANSRGNGINIKTNEYEKQLNGKLIFIAGNHDQKNGTKAIIENMKIKYGGKKINIVHNPKFYNCNYRINFTGHVHQLWQCKRVYHAKGYSDLINVGVDVWNFYPVSFEEIYSRYSGWLRTLKKHNKKREGENQ